MKNLALILIALTVSGCAVAGLPANATTAQKLVADVSAMETIAKDVGAKCGPQFVSLAPLLTSAIAVASSPENVLSDVMAALAAMPTLQQDYKALACVFTTIRDDLRSLKPAPASKLAQELKLVEGTIALLETSPEAATMCVASR